MRDETGDFDSLCIFTRTFVCSVGGSVLGVGFTFALLSLLLMNLAFF